MDAPSQQSGTFHLHTSKHTYTHTNTKKFKPRKQNKQKT